MTGLRIALVGAPDWDGADHARRALAALAPEAEVSHLPVGAVPTPDLDGLWLLTPPPGPAPAPDVHDATTAWALQLGLPLIGPLAGDAHGEATVTAAPGSPLADLVGGDPLALPVAPGGGRPGRDYLEPSGTVWFAQAHRGSAAATITAGGTPFVTLADYPFATDTGVHPLAIAFAGAARERAATRAAPTTRPAGPFAPLPDDGPRSYVHQMRTGGYRWWRPCLALAAGFATFVTISVALSLLWLLLDPSMLESGPPQELDPVAPVPMLITNLMLAGLIPATLVATRVGHWRPMGKVFSVAGRIRWRWLARAGLVTLVVWGVYLAASWFLGGEQPGQRPAHWGWLLVISIFTTPLQSAGEEVAFRGGLMQGVGAWIRRPVLALVVGTAASAVLFALAHTSLDPWVLLDLGSLAIACCYLTWRTGGLEAAIALHVVNNLVIIVGLTLLGGLEDAFVTDQTTSSGAAGGISVASTLVMTLILLHQARAAGVAPKRRGAPATN